MSGAAEPSDPALNPCAHDPYPGLRPYEEDEQHQFFGRDADTQILLDKILTHRLTLLFAATGVGKSSLLKAAVIPKLKAASGKHLDVVYYNDWVTAPLAGLKADIARTVQQSANWPPGTVLDESRSLVEFVQFCTLFVRPPLVIMLDQFEELFRYRNKYHQDTFKPFIEELTGLITATQIPVSIVFSMREDFALELNAFKPKLPTLLFENYYRLERLPAGAARQAIVEPLRPLRFAYEPELLEQLVQDLLKHDPDRDLSSLGADDETETVIPPQLQIVCSQLWQKECDSADRLLHLSTYEEAGRAQGLLKNYVEKALKAFSESDRRILSRAFDHLVSIQGTKMPHTVGTLAEKISYHAISFQRFLLRIAKRISPVFRDKLPDYIKKLASNNPHSTVALQAILEKLASPEVRILRSQQREQQTWYELYHDMYSEGINSWNWVQKRKMLWRQVKIWGIGIIGALLVAYFGTVAYVHSVSHHLRLAPGDENRVEIFRGKHGWPDPFGQQGFYAETRLLSREIEPDKRFLERGILDYQAISTDLIAYRPLEERISAYVYTGDYAKAFELFDQTVKSGGQQAGTVVRRLFSLKNLHSFKKIGPWAASEKNATANKIALQLFQENTNNLYLKNIEAFRIYQQALIQHKGAYSIDIEQVQSSPQLLNKIIDYLSDPNKTIRRQTAEALELVGDRVAVAPLIKALDDDIQDVRQYAAKALGRIGDHVAVDALITALDDDNQDMRQYTAEALGRIGGHIAVDALITALADDNPNVRQYAAEALGRIGDHVAIDALIKALASDNPNGRAEAAEALGRIGDHVAVDALITALTDKFAYVRLKAAKALGLIGDHVAVDALISRLSDNNFLIRKHAVIALGLIGDHVAVDALITALTNDDKSVRLSAVIALRRIGDRVAVDALITALTDDNEEVRRYAVIALGQIGDRVAVEALITALTDDNKSVRLSAVIALGQIGDRVAVEALITALADYSETVRRYAAEALGRIGDRVAVDALKALADDNEYVRQYAAEALGRIGNQVAVDALKALADDNEYVRRYAAEALGRIGDRVAVDALITALTDDNGYVRRYAAIALGQIGDHMAVDALIIALGDDNEYVRRYAAEALGRIGGLSGIKFKRLSADNKVNQPTQPYRWYDYFSGKSFQGRLQEIYGTIEHRQQLLAALNLSVPEARDLLFLQLATNPEAHNTIRRKAITELGEKGVNKQKIIAELQTLKSEKVVLKRAITTAINKLTKKPQKQPEENKLETPQLKTDLKKLEQQYAEWRTFRDSKTQEDFTKPEDYDKFLAVVRSKKAQISPVAAFDHAYAITEADPETGLTLLTHPLARARQGAYTAFMMKANIEWLDKLDQLREQSRNDPIFRHAAFRAIDLGLQRLHFLGNKDNDDREYKQLMEWQKRLEADQARKQAHIDAGDIYKTGEDAGQPVDEALERLQWTTLMMEHTKKMTEKYAKDGWVRDWPENALPVNQPYPELNP